MSKKVKKLHEKIFNMDEFCKKNYPSLLNSPKKTLKETYGLEVFTKIKISNTKKSLSDSYIYERR